MLNVFELSPLLISIVSYLSPLPTAAQLGIKFIETSAKNSSNIDSSFENMALDVLKKISTLKN